MGIDLWEHHPASFCICSRPLEGNWCDWELALGCGRAISMQWAKTLRNCVFSPERSVSFSKWQYGAGFGKLWLDFYLFFFCPLGTEGFCSAVSRSEARGSETMALPEAGTACCRDAVVMLLSSHYLHFQNKEKHFRPLKAAVNGQHWLWNVAEITETLISHHSTPFYFLLLKIYQTLHLFT